MDINKDDSRLFIGKLYSVLEHVKSILGAQLFSCSLDSSLLTYEDIIRAEKNAKTGHFTPETLYFYDDVSYSIGIYDFSDSFSIYHVVFDDVERLIYYRRLCGLSQQEAGLHFGIPVSTWEKWERKLHKPHLYLWRCIINELQLMSDCFVAK